MITDNLVFGLVGPDLPNPKDHIKLPPKGKVAPIDLTGVLNILPSDQLQFNSCSGHATAKLLEACVAKQSTSPFFPRLSANFLYLHARPNPDVDQGAGLRNVALAAVKAGSIPQNEWKDHENPILLPKGVSKYPDDRRYRLPSVERVNSLDDLLSVLSLERVPVITGIAIQKKATDILYKSGYAPAFDPSDPVLGYHAELAVGWEWRGGEVWIKWVGSWGLRAGKAGYYWRPASYFHQKAVVDMWTVGKEFF